MAKVYFRAFQTGIGGAAMYITTTQWRQSAGREKSDVTFRGGDDVWYCYPKSMHRNDAKSAVVKAYDAWVENSKPSVAEYRKHAMAEDVPKGWFGL